MSTKGQLSLKRGLKDHGSTESRDVSCAIDSVELTVDTSFFIFIFFLFIYFFLKKEEPAQVGTPIHHTLLYAKMFYKMGLAYSYTYRATETGPTEHRIEKKKGNGA